MHNTGDCKKYNSDGTLKKGFAGKNAQRNLRNRITSHEQITRYVQLSAKIVKLKESNRKFKHTNKKCKHDYYSNSDDSDAS